MLLFCYFRKFKLEFVGQFGNEAALGPLFEGAGKNL